METEIQRKTAEFGLDANENDLIYFLVSCRPFLNFYSYSACKNTYYTLLMSLSCNVALTLLQKINLVILIYLLKAMDKLPNICYRIMFQSFILEEEVTQLKMYPDVGLMKHLK